MDDLKFPMILGMMSARELNQHKEAAQKAGVDFSTIPSGETFPDGVIVKPGYTGFVINEASSEQMTTFWGAFPKPKTEGVKTTNRETSISLFDFRRERNN